MTVRPDSDCSTVLLTHPDSGVGGWILRAVCFPSSQLILWHIQIHDGFEACKEVRPDRIWESWAERPVRKDWKMPPTASKLRRIWPTVEGTQNDDLLKRRSSPTILPPNHSTPTVSASLFSRIVMACFLLRAFVPAVPLPGMISHQYPRRFRPFSSDLFKDYFINNVFLKYILI